MKLFAWEEWEAANANYAATEPPFWHAKMVPDAFSAISGILWSISYILMIRKSFKDKSYSMPIYSLCLNITWETTFGFVYGPGLVNQIIFAQWMIVDVFLVYATVKYGATEWKRSPLVANNLAWVILFGCTLGMLAEILIAATFVPIIGRQVVFMTAWPIQITISLGYLAQLFDRGSTRGQTWGIWATRAFGTLAAGCCFHWRAYYWPERYAYAWSPYGAFLLFTSHFLDFVYPVAFAYVKSKERELVGQNGAAVAPRANGFANGHANGYKAVKKEL